MVISVGNMQQMPLPMVIKMHPAIVTLRFPNLFARGQTAKMPIPMGMPPITEIMVWVMPSL